VVAVHGKIRWADGADDAGDNFVTRAELMAYLRLEAPACTAVSMYHGLRQSRRVVGLAIAPRLCTDRHVPEPLSGEFLSGHACRRGAAPCHAPDLPLGGPPGQRPLFVVMGTQPDARGIGRSQCLRTLAEVVGGAVEVSAAEPA